MLLQRSRWCLVFFFGCVACSTASSQKLAIQDIRIVKTADRGLVSNCHLQGSIVAKDGKVGPGPQAYHGTKERAMMLLRKRAVELGADTVWIEAVLYSVVSNDAPGSVVEISGYGYKCK